MEEFEYFSLQRRQGRVEVLHDHAVILEMVALCVAKDLQDSRCTWPRCIEGLSKIKSEVQVSQL